MLSNDQRQRLVADALTDSAAAADYWSSCRVLDGLQAQGYTGPFTVHAARGLLDLPADAASDQHWHNTAEPPPPTEHAPSGRGPLVVDVRSPDPLAPPPPLTIFDRPDRSPDDAYRARWC